MSTAVSVGLRLAAGLIPALVVIACGSTSETTSGPTAVKCSVDVRVPSTGFSAAGGSGTVQIATARECVWSASADAGWLSIAAPAAGRGDATLAFTVAANTTPSARGAHIGINDRQVEVSQQGSVCELHVSSNRESLGAAGGTRTIGVKTNSAQCPWTAATDARWIKISKGASGTGNGEVSFEVEATDGPPRSGKLTIGVQVVTVVQSEGCSVSVAPATATLPAAGGSGSITVQAGANCPWSAASDATWLVIASGSAGTGAGEVRFSAQPYDGPGRTAVIRIADQAVTVTQGSGCALSVTPTSISVGSESRTEHVDVTGAAGCGWTAVSSVNWAEVASGDRGTGDGRVDLAIARNSGPERRGSLTIAGKTIPLAQASGCRYDVSPRAVDLPGAGGTARLSLDTDAACTWTAAPSAGWIGVSAHSGTGSVALQVTAEANLGQARSGSVAVAGVAVKVTQPSSCTVVLAPPALDYDAAGGAGTVLVIVTGACAWTATSESTWIRITTTPSGTGDGLVQFNVAANAGAARTGSLTIAGLSVPIRQSAK